MTSLYSVLSQGVSHSTFYGLFSNNPVAYYDFTQGYRGDETNAATSLRWHFDTSGNWVPVAHNILFKTQAMDSVGNWALTRATVTGDAGTDPDGGSSADKIVENTDNDSHAIYQNFAQVAGSPYTFSCYLKAAERSWAVLRLTSGATSYAKFFDIANGTVGGTWGTAPDDSGIEDVGGGWYRAYITVNAIANTVTDGANIYTADADGTAQPIYQGDGSSGILAWGAQVERHDELRAYVANDGTAAVYGPVYEAAVANRRIENIFVGASDISNTSDWTSLGTPVRAADGIGWSIEDNDGAGSEGVRQIVTCTGSTEYRFQCYLEKTTSAAHYPWLSFQGSTGGTAKNVGAVIDTDAGSVSTQTGDADLTEVFITSHDDDWWHVSFVLTTNASNTTLRFEFYPAYNTDGSATADVTATGTISMAVPVIQLAISDTEMIATPVSYAVDYWTGTVESQNLVPAARDLTDTDWSGSTDVSFTANQTEGYTSGQADQVTYDTAATARVFTGDIRVRGGASYVFEFWAKAGTTGAFLPEVRDQTTPGFIGSGVEQTAGSDWTLYSREFVAPAGCGAVRLYLTRDATGANDGDTIFFDDVHLREKSAGSAFVATSGSAITKYALDGLRVERSATNLAVQNERFDATTAAWTLGNATVTDGDYTSSKNVDGAFDKVVESSGGAVTHRLEQAITYTAADYWMIMRVRADERNWIMPLLDPANNDFAFFDSHSGAVGTVGAGCSDTYVAYVGDGVWDFGIKCTMAAGSATTTIRLADDDNSSSYAGDGTSGLHIGAVHIELANGHDKPTSLIKTYAATAARTEDKPKGPTVTLSDGFTLQVQYRLPSDMGSAEYTQPLNLRIDGNNRVNFVCENSTVYVSVVNGGTTVATLTASVGGTKDEVFNAAVRIKTDDMALYVNGTQEATDTLGTPPSGDFPISFYNPATSNEGRHIIQSASIHTYPMTNSELAVLSQVVA